VLFKLAMLLRAGCSGTGSTRCAATAAYQVACRRRRTRDVGRDATAVTPRPHGPSHPREYQRPGAVFQSPVCAICGALVGFPCRPRARLRRGGLVCVLDSTPRRPAHVAVRLSVARIGRTQPSRSGSCGCLLPHGPDPSSLAAALVKRRDQASLAGRLGVAYPVCARGGGRRIAQRCHTGAGWSPSGLHDRARARRPPGANHAHSPQYGAVDVRQAAAPLAGVCVPCCSKTRRRRTRAGARVLTGVADGMGRPTAEPNGSLGGILQ
jgi:hypothetical protein